MTDLDTLETIPEPDEPGARFVAVPSESLAEMLLADSARCNLPCDAAVWLWVGLMGGDNSTFEVFDSIGNGRYQGGLRTVINLLVRQLDADYQRAVQSYTDVWRQPVPRWLRDMRGV